MKTNHLSSFPLLVLALILPLNEGKIPSPDSSNCRAVYTQEILVCDPDGIFTAKEISEIEASILSIRNETESPCNMSQPRGFTLRLVVYKFYNESLFPESSDVKQKHIERMQAYTNFLYKQYADEETSRCDDNVLIFISKDDKTVQIAMGTEVKSLLSKDFQHRLNKEITSRLSRGNVLSAVQFGLSAVGNELRFGPSRQTEFDAQHRKATITIASVMIVIVLAFGTLMFVILRWRKKRRRNRNMSDPIPEGTIGYDSMDDDDDIGQRENDKQNEPNKV